MSAWLPDSYPTAPAPVTAVFAGLLTKVGVYAIIRTQTLLFPDSPLQGLLMWAALLTMVIGILGAVSQSGLKRILSFTLVSHIGYMIFGIALATPEGTAGAIFYVAHHITIQTALFLITGLVERLGGHDVARPARRPRRRLPRARDALLRLGDEPLRHPTAVGLPRQDRPARRRHRRSAPRSRGCSSSAASSRACSRSMP